MNNTITNKLEHFYGIRELDDTSLAYISQFEKDGEYDLEEGEDLNGLPFEVRYDAHWMGKYHAVDLLLNYYNKGNDSIYEQLQRCIRACLLDSFVMHGYLGELSGLKLVIQLMKNGLKNSVCKNHENAELLRAYVKKMRIHCNENNVYSKSAQELIELYDVNIIFTYGTLMKGQRNHAFVRDDAYIGDAVLENYGLLELNGFPGAVRKEGYKVMGELYHVTEEEKERIDQLEGTLYTYKTESFRCNGVTYTAGFYEYNFPEEQGYRKMRPPYGKWTDKEMSDKNYVWYVCYGSNLCYERFMKYIDQTSEKTPPLCKENILIHHPLYYSSYTRTWGGAKLFLDLGAYGKTYGVKYLITKKQYSEIKRMEGPDYDLKYCLGLDEFHIPEVTFTTSQTFPTDYKMSQSYKDVVRRGIEENYGDSIVFDYYLMPIWSNRMSDSDRFYL